MEQIKVELQDWMGDDRRVASSAWTSSLDQISKEQRNDEDVARVVNFLADHKHSTPFESVVLHFHVRLPISADRQLMTHRVMSSNGLSGRYRTMPNDWQSVPPDVLHILNVTPGLAECGFDFEYAALCDQANQWYRSILVVAAHERTEGTITGDQYKRLREFFRGVLPQNNMTDRTLTINLRSWANFIKLRNSDHAQPEIREVAKLMLDEVRKANFIPVALAALERNAWTI